MDEKTQNKYNFGCEGGHPWKNQNDICPCYPKVLQRGSSSVYFPVTASSLVIPPFSNIINNRIENSDLYNDFRNKIEEIMEIKINLKLTEEQVDGLIQSKIDEYAEKIADNIGCKREQVREILSRRITDGEKIIMIQQV